MSEALFYFSASSGRIKYYKSTYWGGGGGIAFKKKENSCLSGQEQKFKTLNFSYLSFFFLTSHLELP